MRAAQRQRRQLAWRNPPSRRAPAPASAPAQVKRPGCRARRSSCRSAPSHGQQQERVAVRADHVRGDRGRTATSGARSEPSAPRRDAGSERDQAGRQPFRASAPGAGRHRLRAGAAARHARRKAPRRSETRRQLEPRAAVFFGASNSRKPDCVQRLPQRAGAAARSRCARTAAGVHWSASMRLDGFVNMFVLLAFSAGPGRARSCRAGSRACRRAARRSAPSG